MRNANLIGLLLLLAAAPVGAADINVVGTTSGKAVLIIDGGKPRTLSVGETSPEGVKLIGATSQSATFEFAGRRETLAPGQHTHISTGGPPARDGGGTVVLTADARGHFFTTGTVNGVSLRFMVDTGASSIAMSAEDARRTGVNYLSGVRGRAQTANGLVTVYHVKLDSVRVGEITLNNVDAVVVEAGKLPIALLGMSFLNRTEMRRDGDTLTLIRRY